jgi:DNA-binding MarR family transcriptional regulator
MMSPSDRFQDNYLNVVSLQTISLDSITVRADVPESHLAAWRALLDAHATLVGGIEQALAAASLPPLSWYDVLWAIRRAPGRRLRMAELAQSLTISRGGLTKQFDRLESAGLVRREPAADDGRGLFAVITPAGNRMLRKMWPIYARALREDFVAAVSPREAKTIEAALRRAAGSPPERNHI